jgi:catechol 2,3-dioxygenase-like lactoylglutathione lyase family enzyme
MEHVGIVALDEVRAELAMLRTPDGQGEIELVKFHSPPTPDGDPRAPANAPGFRHLAFLVEDIDAVVAGLQARGTELVGELVRYENNYRLCYVRGLDRRAGREDQLTGPGGRCSMT